ncbi:MAG: alpha-glucosidase [Erysipelotrichaceae bacterium]|nr:alpha-glucosidase [Erysipelotrichaceae bacterium]
MNWKETAVGYEIYPYSFLDSNGDGYGDLKGILEKLDYLQELGVDLLWLCPVYVSPRDDNGYDVADQKHVDPLLGSDEDLERLIEEVHQRGMHILLDLVLNHVSKEHYWFQEAIKSKDDPYHDYFLFRDPLIINGKKCPPNHWQGFFSTSVWTYVPQLDQYYFHIFAESMPDLNWQNEEVRREIKAIARYWLEKGIDGFRLDAAAHLAKDWSFRDPEEPLNDLGLIYHTDSFSNRPENFLFLKELKEDVFDHYDCLCIGEVGGCASTQLAKQYADRKYGVFDMVFNFDTCWENGAYGSVHKSDEEISLDVVNLKKNFLRWYDDCAESCEMPLYWLNHDHPRVLSQYGNKKYRRKSGKMLEGILLFLYGLPFLYQGEELGLLNVDYEEPEDFFAEVGDRNFVTSHPELSKEVLLRYLRRCSRLNGRAPLPWTAGKNAGFSSGTPYLKMTGDSQEVYAEKEVRDPDSIYHFVKRAITLRKEHNEAARYGKLEIRDIEDPELFVYTKETAKEKLLVIANMKETQREMRLPADAVLLLSNTEEARKGDLLQIGAYDFYLYRI